MKIIGLIILMIYVYYRILGLLLLLIVAQVMGRLRDFNGTWGEGIHRRLQGGPGGGCFIYGGNGVSIFGLSFSPFELCTNYPYGFKGRVGDL